MAESDAGYLGGYLGGYSPPSAVVVVTSDAGYLGGYLGGYSPPSAGSPTPVETNTLRLGGITPTALNLGALAVSRVYLGSTIVYALAPPMVDFETADFEAADFA